MRGGDLSNKVSPRHVVVFEGGLAVLPADNIPLFEKAMKRKRYFEAITYWDWKAYMLNQIERLIRRTDINIEVCTWIGADLEHADFALAIENALDRMNVPVRSVWSSTPDELAKMLPHLPDIACIYDPEPSHILKFGSRGVILTSPSQIGRGR